MNALGRHRWAGCLGAAVLVHAGLVMAALWPADPPSLAVGGGGGEGGYAVSLGGLEGAEWVAAASAAADAEAAVETADAAPAPPAPVVPPDPMEVAATQAEPAPVAPSPIAVESVEVVGDLDSMPTAVTPPPPDLSEVSEAAELASLDVAADSPAEIVDLAAPAGMAVDEPDMALEPAADTGTTVQMPPDPTATEAPPTTAHVQQIEPVAEVPVPPLADPQVDDLPPFVPPDVMAATPEVNVAAVAEPLNEEIDPFDEALAEPMLAETSVEIPPRPTRRPTPPAQPAPAPQPVQIASAPQPALETLEGPPAPDDGGIASDPGSDGPAGPPGEGAGTDPGTDEGAGGGVGGGISPNYLASLQAWLERHRDYPTRARRLAQEGTALLYFSMDRSGRVLEARLAQSSGYDLLDQAVMEMIARADPLPPMPQEMAQVRLELVVPVQFSLR